jgi:hypothetical protein
MTTLRPVANQRRKSRGGRKPFPWPVQIARAKIQQLVSENNYEAAHALATEYGWTDLVQKPEERHEPVNPAGTEHRDGGSKPDEPETVVTRVVVGRPVADPLSGPSTDRKRRSQETPRPRTPRLGSNRRPSRRTRPLGRRRTRFVPPPLPWRYRGARTTTTPAPGAEAAVGELCSCGIWVAAGSESLHECP